MEGKKEILIIGAGFAGVRVALDLAKHRDKLHITVVNKTPYHCICSELYQTAGAVMRGERKLDFQSLSGTVNIPLQEIFAGKNIGLIVDTVKEVDLPNKKVKTESGKDLSYDYLVMAMGSTTNYFGITGAEDFSHPLKTTEEAINIRNDLDEIISARSYPIQIVMAGGGFTGVELSSELSVFLSKLAQKHHRQVGHIVVVEASPNVLGGMPEWAQKKALYKLSNLGVEVMTGKMISRVEENMLITKENQEIPFDYLIWTTGVKGEDLNQKIKGVVCNKKCQIHVESDLSLRDFPDVFVIGDMAECIDEARDCPVASTAWAAISQAEAVAKNIVAKIDGKRVEKYMPPSPAFVVPIGSLYGLSNYANLQISGIIGWMMKRVVALNYLVSIFPINTALNYWLKGVMIYSANE